MIICNLFFIFDPSIRFLHSSWIIALTILLIPALYPLTRNFTSFLNSSMSLFVKEIKFRIPLLIKGYNPFLVSLLFLILLYNFLALFPHLFSVTSHLTVTLPLAYIIWSRIFIFNLTTYSKYFLSHFIPLGTPIFLISFIVIVELLRNLIRPLALTFRLTTNIIAGHLLIALICNILISIQQLILYLED